MSDIYIFVAGFAAALVFVLVLTFIFLFRISGRHSYRLNEDIRRLGAAAKIALDDLFDHYPRHMPDPLDGHARRSAPVDGRSRPQGTTRGQARREPPQKNRTILPDPPPASNPGTGQASTATPEVGSAAYLNELLKDVYRHKRPSDSFTFSRGSTGTP